MKSNRAFVSITVMCLLVFPILNVAGQSLTFCKSIDEQGMPSNAATEFSISKDGGPVIFFLQIPSTVTAKTISYDIYKLDKGKEVFNTTIDQQIITGRNWLSKEVTIYDGGSYRVYVYDENDQLITKASFIAKKPAD